MAMFECTRLIRRTLILTLTTDRVLHNYVYTCMKSISTYNIILKSIKNKTCILLITTTLHNYKMWVCIIVLYMYLLLHTYMYNTAAAVRTSVCECQALVSFPLSSTHCCSSSREELFTATSCLIRSRVR